MQTRPAISAILLLSAIFLIALPSELKAKRIKQVHKIETSGSKKNKSPNQSRKPIRIISDSIKFVGYDKPAGASRETFHILNSTTREIKKVGIRITYLDLQNRMLHMRDTEVECIVPGGETRMTSIPTWDIQRTFFYYLSQEPKRVATPYKVTIDLLWAEL